MSTGPSNRTWICPSKLSPTSSTTSATPLRTRLGAAVWRANTVVRMSVMVVSNSRTTSWMRSRTSSRTALLATAWRLIPAANSRWITVSWRSLAMRSRSARRSRSLCVSASASRSLRSRATRTTPGSSSFSCEGRSWRETSTGRSTPSRRRNVVENVRRQLTACYGVHELAEASSVRSGATWSGVMSSRSSRP